MTTAIDFKIARRELCSDKEVLTRKFNAALRNSFTRFQNKIWWRIDFTITSSWRPFTVLVLDKKSKESSSWLSKIKAWCHHCNHISFCAIIDNLGFGDGARWNVKQFLMLEIGSELVPGLACARILGQRRSSDCLWLHKPWLDQQRPLTLAKDLSKSC